MKEKWHLARKVPLKSGLFLGGITHMRISIAFMLAVTGFGISSSAEVQLSLTVHTDQTTKTVRVDFFWEALLT